MTAPKVGVGECRDQAVSIKSIRPIPPIGSTFGCFARVCSLRIPSDDSLVLISGDVYAGDQVLVLPEVDQKNLVLERHDTN